MNQVLYIPIAIAMAIVQGLPLKLVAVLGQIVGEAAWWIDWRHRRMAVANVQTAFAKERSTRECRRIARENFRRLGESFLCAVKASAMRREDVAPCLQVVGETKIRPFLDAAGTSGVVVATGHFGNIEMYGEAARTLPWVEPIAVYHPTKHVLLNRAMQNVRKESAVLYYDERTEMAEMRKTVRDGGVLLGVMGDCSSGPRGRQATFFDRPVATQVGPLVHALRFRMPLFCAVCFRTGLGRWRVELSDRIETHSAGKVRPSHAVLNEMNLYFETAIRRDPANWCWAHPRWQDMGRPPKGEKGTDG